MRSSIFLAMIVICSGANAQEYQLQAESVCSAVGGGRLNFKCGPAKEDYAIYVYRSSDQWILKHVWKNPHSDRTWKLELVKDDQDVLVLSQPVLFSGTRLFHLIKKRQEYFVSDVAHASLGSEVSVTHGKLMRSSR